MSLSDLNETALVEQGMGEGPQTGGAAGAAGAISAADALRLARRSGFELRFEGDELVYAAPDYPIAYSIIGILRRHKPEIVDVLRDERRAVLRWIADNFRSSPLGRCAHCGGGKREDDPFVLVFVGHDRADFHASCHPAWVAEQEKPRLAPHWGLIEVMRRTIDAGCHSAICSKQANKQANKQAK